MRTAEITIGNQSADRPFFDSDMQYQAAVCVLYHNLIVSLLNYCNNIIRIHWNENCTIQTILQYAETTANVQDTKCSKSLKSPITGEIDNKLFLCHSELSERCKTEIGVPPGSVLGPVLFLSYVNGINRHIHLYITAFIVGCINQLP